MGRKCQQKTPARGALPGFLRSLAYIRRAIVRLAGSGGLRIIDDLYPSPAERNGTHHEELIANLNGLRSDLNFDSSLSLRSMAEDLATIDAGFEQLDALARAQPGER